MSYYNINIKGDSFKDNNYRRSSSFVGFFYGIFMNKPIARLVILSEVGPLYRAKIKQKPLQFR